MRGVFVLCVCENSGKYGWPFNNLDNHDDVTCFFVCFLLSGMNVNQRELNTHVEFEPDSYYSAFSAELEICSSPMWSMLAHCREAVC